MPPDRRVQRIVRVRTGCLTCRRRKKKCDETRPICAGCQRNDLGCQWPDVPGKRDPSHEDETQASTVDECRPNISDEIHEMAMPRSPSSHRTPSISSSAGHSVTTGDQFEDTTLHEETHNRRQLSTATRTAIASDSLVASFSIGNVLPRSLSMMPGYDAESYQLLSHYVATTADCMANGSTPVNPFLVQIVPLAFSSDLLLQLVITQSAAHRAFRSRDESDTIAHSHYTKALQHFRRGVTDFINGKESNPLVLLVGALLMCFTETAKGDMNGTIFDHLSAANSLLVKLLAQSDSAVPRDLKDFVIEYYTYTATVSMISIDARFSGQIFLNLDLEQRSRELLQTQYVGNLCGCWLELLLLIPCIFDLGRQWIMDDTQALIPTADDIAMFASIQAQILRWSPYPNVETEVRLAGLIFQQAILVYLYTSLGGFQYTRDGMYKGMVENVVTEAMSYLDELSPSARINSGLCWPIAVVGSCLLNPDQQNCLRGRLNAMTETFGLGNMNRTLLLLEAMWESPASEAGPWNISRAMQQNQIWISFA
ncbi:transcriptional regulator family: Fungal Specific TF [Penicillium psychrosexuale]|uniref:transcriptional regulator family: Fungal Specific TF n=1 Tax=Penicillium psychrosexuale TaxID=1002107 RepID=UPI0025456201|nr:transcriptional regulator family: Fungal Specific TF [Penicillium psychrosexuale]KAJ5795774.1 transcriptional regulator family: Fungal Specific TF [Penicillium psychrosexuale]